MSTKPYMYFLPALFQFLISALCSFFLKLGQAGDVQLRRLRSLHCLQSGPGPRNIDSELGMALWCMSLEWVLLLDGWQTAKAGGSMDVSALALMMFSRPLMLGCLHLLGVLPVLSSTHMLFSSQTWHNGWLHVCEVVCYQRQLLCSSRHHTLLTAIAGRRMF